MFLILIRSFLPTGVEETEGAPRVAAETKLKGQMRHMRAYLTAGDERARAYRLMGTMKTQARDTFPKTRYLGRHLPFIMIEIHA